MKYSLKLASMDDHVKNYRPQILCLSGKPNARPALVRLASKMTHNVSLCLYGICIFDGRTGLTIPIVRRATDPHVDGHGDRANHLGLSRLQTSLLSEEAL